MSQMFNPGARVEVQLNEAGFDDSYYQAHIISHGFRQQSRLIEYATLKTHSGSPLLEEVPTSQLRPSPVRMQLKEYNVGDIVDMWMRGGWWKGKVVHITGPIYVVEAQHPWEFLLFPVWRLRLHMEFQTGVWSFSQAYNN